MNEQAKAVWEAAQAMRGARGVNGAPIPPAELRYQYLDTDELFAPLPAPLWVVRDLYIGPGRPIMVAGFGFSGKSIASQELALATATGGRVWGHFRTHRGRVLHIDHEQGEYGTRSRYQRLARGMGVDREALGDRLRTVVLPDVYLTTTGMEDFLAREVDGVSLAIFDSLRAATPGADENDSTIRTYLDILTRVSDKTHCAFIVIHHAGKGKSGGDGDQRETPRGSGAIFDACGTVLTLTGAASGEPVRVHMSKAAAEACGATIEDFHLGIEDVPNDDASDMHWGLRVRYMTPEQVHPPVSREQAFAGKVDEVLDFIRNNPGARGVTHIAEVMGIRQATVREAVRALADAGRVVNVGTDQRPRLFVKGAEPSSDG